MKLQGTISRSGGEKEQKKELESKWGTPGTHGGVVGKTVSSRPCGDVDMEEGQDDKTVCRVRQ